MILFNGLLKKKIQSHSREFYEIIDLESNKKYKLNKTLIEVYDGIEINKTYPFIKNLKEDGKEFISITHPQIQIDEDVEFEIISKELIGGEEYFLLKSDYNHPLKVRAYSYQHNMQTVSCRVKKYINGVPQLINNDTPWKIDEKYFFQIINIQHQTDKNGKTYNIINIDIGQKLPLKVLGRNYHSSDLWKFQNIECKVISITSDGFPQLSIIDQRHPYFKVGETHQFEIVGSQFKTKKSGKSINFFIVSDNFGLEYELNTSQNLLSSKQKGDKIYGSVFKIDGHVQLITRSNDDPNFHLFEEIIKNSLFKEKYFTPYLNNQNAYSYKLLKQYCEGSGFWIITYLNYTLPLILNSLRENKNLKELNSVLNLQIDLNSWILETSFLRNIEDSSLRKKIKEKVTYQMDQSTKELSIVQNMLNPQSLENIEKLIRKKDLSIINHYLLLNDDSNFMINEIINILINLDQNLSNNLSDKHWTISIFNTIKKRIGNIEQYFDKNHFILSTVKDKKNSQLVKNQSKWIFVCYCISGNLNNRIEQNFFLSNLFRLFSLIESNLVDQKKLLRLAFKCISDAENVHNHPFGFINGEIEINHNKLIEIDHQEINNKKLTKTFYSCNLRKKYGNGFHINLEGQFGILPYQNINDRFLKNFTFNELNWNTTINIEFFSNDFNFFQAKQLSIENPDYLSRNMSIEQLSIGDVVNIKIKEIVDYGIFVSSGFGDGLIHNSEISESYISLIDKKSIFHQGLDTIAVVINIQDSKIEFSLKAFIGTSYQERYENLMSNSIFNLMEIEEKYFDKQIDIKIEKEKASILERAAVLYSDMTEKDIHFNLAKTIYSNVNDARSYLLGNYLDYLNLLKKLDHLINDYTFEKYEDFKKEIKYLSNQVKQKTLQTFPETKNLTFFVEILSLFNDKSNESVERLLELIKDINEKDKMYLKTVAKNVLANNLLLSEIDELNIEDTNQFTLKNLKRLREFITKGVLNLTDTPEDILEKELQEKRKYWLGRISEDEGENLEFKATFFTPVDNNNQLKIRSNIEQQIKNSRDPEKILKMELKLAELEEFGKVNSNIEKKLIYSSLKTLCAFANTNGGTLLIGVSDDKKIFGLQSDFKKFEKGSYRDEFGKFFDSKIKEYFGLSFSPNFLKKEFLSFPEGDILIIEVKPSKEEIFILKNETANPEENLYVRHLSSSEKLTGLELAKFIKKKYHEHLNSYIHKKNEND